MRDLRDIVGRVLEAEGAAVEWVEPECLEVLAPERLREALGLQEWSVVAFGSEAPEDAVRFGAGAEWAGRLEEIIAERGRRLQVSFPQQALGLAQAEMQRLLERGLALNNATWRLAEASEERAAYAGFFFRITAVSEEKRGDLVSFCVNESSGHQADPLVEALLPALERRGAMVDAGSGESTPAWESGREAAARVLPAKIRARFTPFLAAMERRMTRDLDRLHEYYSGLRAEAAAALRDRRRRGEKEELAARDALRLEAAEREYLAKVADLGRKYAVDVKVELLAMLRASMPVRRAQVDLLRRKGRRRIQVDWNPISRTLDQPHCEGCGSAARAFSLCDDRLHLLCSECLPACPSCRKETCRVCSPGRCARCGIPLGSRW